MLVMSVIFSHQYPSIFTLFYFSCTLSCIAALPISSVTPYSELINSLTVGNCKMPNTVHIPFSSNSDPDASDYLSIPLQTCQTDKVEKEDDIARALCTEVFQVLQNITCVEYNTPLPQINSSRFSNDVCRDFFDMRDALPKQKEYIARELTDEVLCKLLCSHKYETLCKILIWSYDVQAQITDALENEAKEEKNTDIGIPVSKDSNVKTQFVNDSNIEQQPSNVEINSENVGTSLAGGSSIAPKQIKKAKNQPTDIHSNDLNADILINSKASVPVSSIVPNKSEASIVDHHKGTTDSITEIISQSEISNNLALANANEQNMDEQTKEDLESNKKNNEDLNHEEGVKPDNGQPKELTSNDHSVNENADHNANHFTSVSNDEKTDKNEKSPSVSQTSDMNKDIASNNNVQTNRKSENSLPVIPEDDKLNSIDLQEQENKNTVNKMQTSSKASTVVNKNKNTEKTKVTESVISSVITSDTPNLTEMQITPEKNDDDQAQEARDQEQYNGTENEDDYAKDYENQPTKDKDTEIKNSIIMTSEVTNRNRIPVDMNPKNNLGRERDEVQIVARFPDQEGGHFFFYFLSIVLILMAGYLIFHNKQKIIALIVEGRHERRRRSHGAGYKKLETK